MTRSRTWRILLILLALGLAVAMPVVASGFWNLHVGANAVLSGDFPAAARALEFASHNLPWRPDLWEEAGTSAYAAGDHATALRLLQVARDKNSLSAAGWNVLGTSLWITGDQSGAISAWLDGTIHFPQEPALLDRLAGGYHETGNYGAEQVALQRRLELADDAAARYRLGLLLMLSDAAQAEAALDGATALNPEVRQAAAALKAALRAAATEDDPANRMVIIGRSLGLVEEWALAAEAFKLAVEADATSAEARAWRGEALQHLNQDGRQDLDAALALGPSSSIVHTLRGLYWRRQGEMSLSLAEYSWAAHLEPQNAALQSLLGEAHAADGDLVAALEAYQNAVELSPQESTYWRLLALFCADHDVQVLEMGVAAGLKAVELAPEDAQAQDALGWAFAQAGYLFKAERSLMKALEENPDFASAHVHLGLTYMRWGQNNLALEHWNQAVQIDGNGPAGSYATQLLKTYFPQR